MGLEHVAQLTQLTRLGLGFCNTITDSIATGLTGTGAITEL